jgi:hypothetical protein
MGRRHDGGLCQVAYVPTMTHDTNEAVWIMHPFTACDA